MTEYRALQAPASSRSHQDAGHIAPVEINPGNEYMVHRHGFLCATPQVNLSVGFQQSLGRASSAATDSCCSGSAARARLGWS